MRTELAGRLGRNSRHETHSRTYPTRYRIVQPDRRLVSGILKQIAADLRQYQDLGVQHFIFSFPAESAAQQQEAMERFSREAMPLIPND